MYEVTDKSGQVINLKDEVQFTIIQGDMFNSGEAKELTGIVVSINSETTVQVQPEEGASLEVETSGIEVTGSLINDIKEMATTEDMVKIMLRAEARYMDELENGTQKKKSGGTAKKAKPTAITGEMKL